MTAPRTVDELLAEFLKRHPPEPLPPEDAPQPPRHPSEVDDEKREGGEAP